jgi:hypothetical protein
MLERLPNELLSFIFRLACKDGGKTAGTLRLLSQRIKAVAAPHRFRTVAVAGADAIVALVAVLGRIPPELRAIEHMFVAPYTASELSTYERRPARPLSDEGQEIVTGTGWAPLRALVSYAGPHVRNLALLALNDIDCMGAFAGIPLLHLQVLTIDVSDDSVFVGQQLILPRVRTINMSVSRNFGGISGANILMRILRPYPELERVHLYGADARRDLSYLATKVAKNLPRPIRCDVHPLVPATDPGMTLADLKEIIGSQDVVHFHEPQGGQFHHYSVWKSLWAQSLQT